MGYKIQLLLTPQSEEGYTVTSPLLPELDTESDSLGEALEIVQDSFAAVLELYQEMGRSLSLGVDWQDFQNV